MLIFHKCYFVVDADKMVGVDYATGTRNYTATSSSIKITKTWNYKVNVMLSLSCS